MSNKQVACPCRRRHRGRACPRSHQCRSGRGGGWGGGIRRSASSVADSGETVELGLHTASGLWSVVCNIESRRLTRARELDAAPVRAVLITPCWQPVVCGICATAKLQQAPAPAPSTRPVVTGTVTRTVCICVPLLRSRRRLSGSNRRPLLPFTTPSASAPSKCERKSSGSLDVRFAFQDLEKSERDD